MFRENNDGVFDDDLVGEDLVGDDYVVGDDFGDVVGADDYVLVTHKLMRLPHVLLEKNFLVPSWAIKKKH